MINTKKELYESESSAVVITLSLAKRLLETVHLDFLRNKVESGKPHTALTRSQIEEIKSLDKNVKRSVMGRPRIEENPAELEGMDLHRYKQRMWKRNSRNRLKNKVSNNQ